MVPARRDDSPANWRTACAPLDGRYCNRTARPLDGARPAESNRAHRHEPDPGQLGLPIVHVFAPEYPVRCVCGGRAQIAYQPPRVLSLLILSLLLFADRNGIVYSCFDSACAEPFRSEMSHYGTDNSDAPGESQAKGKRM